MFQQLLSNHILVTAFFSWLLSGLMKVPIEYWATRQWNWALWFSPGGMPSQHSALVTSTMLAVGLYAGFNTAAFAVAFTLMMVVLYDAAGVRRQAGLHAAKINKIINEFFAGQPISESQLREVIGHTPREVIGGVGFGLVFTVLIWWIWH